MTRVTHLHATTGYESLDEAFPIIECGHEPLGTRVIVQLRTPKGKTKGGIILASETRDADQWNTQVAKVISIGPLAFRNRQTGNPWPEGAWAKEGDFVRVPKFGGDRWQVEYAPPGRLRTPDDMAIFCLFNDLDLVAKVKDPLTVVAFV